MPLSFVSCVNSAVLILIFKASFDGVCTGGMQRGVSPIRGIYIFEPSVTKEAKFTDVKSQSSSKPPAASITSASLAFASTETSPGFATAPLM